MNFFRKNLFNHQRKLFNYQPMRHLWLIHPPKPEVVIGNNTALFATFASLEQHGIQAHPNLTLFYPDDWLDRAHAYYDNEKWGQTIWSLPKVAREIFAKAFPTQVNNDFITWGQMKKLRETTLNLIKNRYGIKVYHGVPTIENTTNGFKINFTTQQQTLKTFYTPADTHFYFWYKVPKEYLLGGILQKPSTDIYQISPQDIPSDLDIIVIGGGLSVVWLAKHFATSETTRKIINLRPASKSLQQIPSNNTVDYSRIISVDLGKADIHLCKDMPNLAIVKSPEHKKEFRGVLYSAIGFVTPEDIVKSVPISQLTSPMKWKTRPWISPKNIPVGSLIESILRWFEITDNMAWGFETQSYHEGYHPFADLMKNKLAQVDIRYSTALDQALTQLDNSLPEDEVVNFLVDLYKKIYHPPPEQIKLFEKSINELLEQQLKLRYTESEESTFGF